MRITFVYPAPFGSRASDAMEPLALAVLRSLTPEAVESSFYDERLESVPLDRAADLVAVTVETFAARRAYQIAAQFRQRGVPVVLGGCHPTLVPEEALAHADAVVVGDAEELWPRLVDDAQRGRLRRIYRQRELPSLAGIEPDRRIFNGKRYAPVVPVQYGRGCRFACDFCSIHALYGGRLRQRPVAEVAAEIEALGRHSGRRLLFFVDDNLFVDPPRTEALLDALEPLGVRWACQVSVDVARDPRLVERMARSGCVVALIGFESLEPANLRQMGKAWNWKRPGYEEALGVFRAAGIMIYGTFVFGYDGDRGDSFDAAVDFALHHKFILANFNPLTPTPGTRLFARLREEGRLLHERWWLDPGYRYGEATFRPRGMSPEELTAGCYRARTRFNTYGSIARRLLDPGVKLRSPLRIGLHLLANLISRREIHSKQGLPLGRPDAPMAVSAPAATESV